MPSEYAVILYSAAAAVTSLSVRLDTGLPDTGRPDAGRELGREDPPLLGALDVLPVARVHDVSV
jgi:hypothetical protein